MERPQAALGWESAMCAPRMTGTPGGSLPAPWIVVANVRAGVYDAVVTVTFPARV